MNNFAPVLIPTLNRHIHFKRCVESLASCIHADETDLFIGLDYPLTQAHWEGYKVIKEYLASITGFKTITIFERKINFGVRKNLNEARKVIFEKYDRLILSEDDNVFAPSFLKFVNKGLEVYETREDIFAVAGYNNPWHMPSWYKSDVYLRQGFTAWGLGIWRDKWNMVDWSLENYNKMLRKKENIAILKRHYKKHIPQLNRIRDTGVITGDGFLLVHIIDKNLSAALPVRSLVRNTGHDGSGLHCGSGDDKYNNQEVFEGIKEFDFPLELQLDEKLIKWVNNKNRPSYLQRVKVFAPPYFRKLARKLIYVW